jgi:long-chain acyl-CoA synthetase
VGADDVQVAAIPLSHAYGIGNIVVPLFTQGTPIIMRDAFVPQRLPEDARRFGARVFPGVPFMFDHFVKNPPAGEWPAGLSNLMSAGAPLEAGVAERFRQRFGVKIRPFYGTSETGGITYDATDQTAVDGLVGTPLPDVTLELVAEEGAPDGGGRVLVRGPAVIESYVDNVDADSFVDGGFLTGDLGTINGLGELTLSGRVSSFVNVAGRKVQPDEVERVLRSREGIVDARVIGMADERRGEQLVACLVTSGERPSILALRQFCGSRLASHKIPRAFVFLPEIPLTERGKTDRLRLRALVSDALSGATGML